MTHIDPTRAQFDAFKGIDRDQPIEMLNLVRFRDLANYPGDHVLARDGLSGADAYQLYGKHSAPALDKVDGDLTPDDFKEIIKQVGKDTAVKGKELYFPVRAAVTGNIHGPDIATVVSIRGKDDVIDTLKQGAGWYDGPGE